VLPGIGPVGTLSMLLPVTFYLPPEASLIMLAGIYYGAQYGGSTTAILVNVPGEAGSIVTCIDGYQMARKGDAGVALAIAALGSFFAGTVSTIVIAFAAPPLTKVAISFGAPEYFALMVLGLTGAVVIARGSPAKATGMVLLGLAFGLVGTDVVSGERRYTFGLFGLYDGIGFAVIALGMLGITEVIANVEVHHKSAGEVSKIGRLWPSRAHFRAAVPAVLRGTALGSLLGVLPGGGALLSSFASYAVEKRIAADPSRLGQGAIEGVAGPEAANNAGAQTSFIPMLTLGIPSNAIMALMVGALMIHGITPGPRVIVDQPQLFWGLIISMWVGNIMLLVINLPMIGLWVQMLRVPYRYLFPVIVLICAIGGFGIGNSAFDVGLVAVFALLGYVARKFDCEPAPFALGFILGPLMEENLRRALLLSRGDPTVFLTQPISATLLFAAAALVCLMLMPSFRRTRETALAED
jgi:putative tricarboxylic transport membrane protein